MASKSLFIPNPTREIERTTERVELALRFDALAQTLEACPRSEDAAILVSTCRNHALATNAVFVDLRGLLAPRENPIGLELKALKCNDIKAAREAHAEVARLLKLASQKRRIWEDRIDLDAQVHDAAAALGVLVAETVQLVLDAQRDLPDGQPALAYDLGLIEDLAPKWRVLCTTIDVLGRVRSALSRLLAVLEAGTESDLFSAPATESWDALIDNLAMEATWWGATRTESDTLDLPSSDGSGLLTLRKKQQPNGLLPAVSAFIAERAETAVADLVTALQTSFKPNVPVAPMPAPFVVDLSVAPLEAERKPASLRIEPRSGNTACPGDSSFIAVLACHVPDHWYRQGDSLHYDEAHVPAVGAVAIAAVRGAADSGAQALVMPELFLPQQCIDAVAELAAELDILVIAGTEAYVDDGRLANEALIIIPNMPPIRQRKQRPSVDEPRTAVFFPDGELKKTTRTRIGTFGVLICSDLSEADIVHMLCSEPDLELLVVVAHTPYPELFERMARADSARYYVNVVMANAGSADMRGNSAFAPLRADGELEMREVILSVPDWPEVPPALRVVEFERVAIMRRAYEKREKGYLPPPHYRCPGGIRA